MIQTLIDYICDGDRANTNQALKKTDYKDKADVLIRKLVELEKDIQAQ